MRTVAAFLLILLGILCLAFSLTSGQWSVMIDPYGQNRDFQAWISTIVLGAGVASLLAVGGGVFILWRGGGPMEAWRPYLTALSRLAAEHGQTISVDRRAGLEFLAFRDGQRISVRAHEAPSPLLIVRGAVAGRQSLRFARVDSAARPGGGTPTLIGGGKGWQLYADLPAIARTFLNDKVMVSMLDRFFAHTETLEVVHDGTGIEVRSALPDPEQVERRTRLALDIVSYLRRVNG